MLYEVIALAGIPVYTQAAGPYHAPHGSIVDLTPPPSLGFGTNPASYPGYGPPVFPGEPGFVPMSFAGQRTAANIAAGLIVQAPANSVATPGIMPVKLLNGQPGLHVATQN